MRKTQVEEESMQPYVAKLSLCCHLVPFTGITTKKKALLSLTQTEAVSLGYDRFLDSVGKLKTTKNNGKKTKFVECIFNCSFFLFHKQTLHEAGTSFTPCPGS